MPTTLKSPKTTASGSGRSGWFAPVHPGEILRETLEDLSLSANRLALSIGVPANRISAIVARRRGVTGETALRLGRYFGTTPNYWMNMQSRYDLETARDAWEARVRAEVRPRSAA
jgi:antitoxin HigA-1